MIFVSMIFKIINIVESRYKNMTVLGGLGSVSRIRGYVNQTLMVILVNIPTISFGLAMGWVSLASGEGRSGGELEVSAVVGAAAATFAASLVAVPICARALAAGRKVTVIATSASFVLCWSLKLAGDGWWMVAARMAAGLGGAGAWAVAPLLAREMCQPRVRGAAVAAIVLAHNLGFLLMYLAADAGVPHRTVLWWCLGLSACHCVVFFFVPESPAYLAANGKIKEARASLAWLRGVHHEDPSLNEELNSLPLPEDPVQSPIKLTKEMFSDRSRRRAFLVSAIIVVGQEMCGVLALLQFAERVFVLARDGSDPASTMLEKGEIMHAASLQSPARLAVMLGAVQLAASAIALYLVEKIGRRPLIVFAGFATGGCLLAAAGAVWGGAGDAWVAAALAGAVAADSAGLQPAPYALLADMFDYQFRGCALMLVAAAACAGNALEVTVFGLAAARGWLATALAVAGALTLALALFAAACVPETRGKTPQQIYDDMTLEHKPCHSVAVTNQCSKVTVCTDM